MSERFEITEDDGSTYIGVEIKKNEDGSISLSMPKNIQKLQDIVFPGLSANYPYILYMTISPHPNSQLSIHTMHVTILPHPNSQLSIHTIYDYITTSK
jgi:hypothetical protein